MSCLNASLRPEFCHCLEQGRRLRLFCDAYASTQRHEILYMVEGRLQFLCDYLLDGVANGNAACAKMVEEGHLALYRREIEALKRHRPVLEEALA